MICAAVRGGNAITTMAETTSINHTNSGMRASVMPLQRMLMIVAITLIALAVVPIPLTIMLRIQ